MTIVRAVRGLVVTAAAMVAMGVSWSTVGAQGQAIPQIKQVPCETIISVEGQDNFGAYCAVCHGADGKGNGPAAPALKGPIPDLTTIAKRHDGKFDAVAVERVVSGADKVPTAHGTVAMPMWGPVFRSSDAYRQIATVRLKNLVQYLESIQLK